MTWCLLEELLSSQRDYISTCWHAATSGVLFCFHKSLGNTNSAECETQGEQRSAVQAQSQGLPGSCLQHRQTWTHREKILIWQICLEKKKKVLKLKKKLNKSDTFQPSSIFSSGHFLDPYDKLSHPQLSLAKQLPVCCLLCENPLPFPCFDHVSH